MEHDRCCQRTRRRARRINDIPNPRWFVAHLYGRGSGMKILRNRSDIVPSLQMLFVATAAISKRFENGNRVKSIRYCILTSNAFLRPFLLSYRGEIVVLEWDKSDRSQWIPMRYCILYNLIFWGDHQNDAMRPKLVFYFQQIFFQKNMFLNSLIRRM